MKTEQDQIEAIVEIFAKSQKRCRSVNDVILQKHYAEALIKAGYGDISEYKAEIERLKNANSELTDNLVFYKDKSYKLERSVDKLKTEFKQLETNAEILAEGVRDLNRENYELTEKNKQAQIDTINTIVKYCENSNHWNELKDCKLFGGKSNDLRDFLNGIFKEVDV